jgi:hypothetical protein
LSYQQGNEEETMSDYDIPERLEELRAELRAERISYGELAELQDLVEHIDRDDVELLEAAGVPEHRFTKEQLEDLLNVETVLQHYRIAQIWTGLAEYPDDGEHTMAIDEAIEDPYSMDLGEEINSRMLEDVRNFCNAIRPILARAEVPEDGENLTAEQIGHDFSLTRNHHGAGFWDRGWGELGDELTDAAQSMGGAALSAYREDEADSWHFTME